MNNEPYAIADLTPDELREIQRFEQQFSEKNGHSIALIAYDQDGKDAD